MITNKTIANRLIEQGFDETYIRGGEVHSVCSQCEVLVINGCSTHETGCSNNVHECAGCHELLPMNQRYCQDCD